MTTSIYEQVGFESIEKLKEYGRSIGKNDYVGSRATNFNECYKYIFDRTVEDTVKFRQQLFPVKETPVITPTVTTISMNNDSPTTIWTYGCILSMGDNITKSHKICEFVIPLSNLPKYNKYEIEKYVHFKLTPLIISSSTASYKNIVMNIINYYFQDKTLFLTIDTCVIEDKKTSDVAGWGRDKKVKAHLTISLYKNELPTFKPKWG